MEGSQRQQADDEDSYSSLLTLAVELDQELDRSERSKVVVKSCEMYFRHTLMRLGRDINEAGFVGKASVGSKPANKKARISNII